VAMSTSGETVSERLSTTKQWYWRQFIQNVLLFFMFFFMVSPMITYAIAMSMRVDPTTSTIYTIAHLMFGLVLFIVDIMRVVYSEGSKFYLFGQWYDSPYDFWFKASEVAYQQKLEFSVPEQVLKQIAVTTSGNQQMASPQTPISVTVKDVPIKFEKYSVFYVELPQLEEAPKRIILLPKEFDSFEEAFVTHKEIAPVRYPVPARVSYGTFTLMLNAEYAGEPLPIYEATFFPALVEQRQALMPWFQPNSKDVELAFARFDESYGTHWRLKYQNLWAFTKSLIKEKEDREKYAEYLANSAVEYYERTMKPPSSSTNLGWFRRHWKVLLIGSSVAIIAFVIVFAVVPMLSSPSYSNVPTS